MKLRILIINTLMSILATCHLLNLNVSAEVIHLEGSGYFSYEINNNEATITSCQLDSNIDKLTIPTQIDGYNVVEIGEKSFFMHPDIKEVTIPKSVHNIGVQALGYKQDVLFDDNTQEYILVCVKIYDFIIKGYTGTAAETYANKNGFTFIALDDEPVTTTVPVTTDVTTTTKTTVATIQITTPNPTESYESQYQLSINSLPDKTDYEIGDKLDLTGLKVNLDFYDQKGGHHTIYNGVSPLDNPVAFIVNTSEFDSSKAGTYTIEIICKGQYASFSPPASFEVIVNDSSAVATTTSTSSTENTTTTTVTTIVTDETNTEQTTTPPTTDTGNSVSTETSTVPPTTTTGTETTLPQTGYSKWYQALIAAAMGMIGVGSTAIIKSYIFRKKENNS